MEWAFVYFPRRKKYLRLMVSKELHLLRLTFLASYLLNYRWTTITQIIPQQGHFGFPKYTKMYSWKKKWHIKAGSLGHFGMFQISIFPQIAYFASWTELGHSSDACLTSSLRQRAHLFLSGLSKSIDWRVTSGGTGSASRLRSNGRPESQ